MDLQKISELLKTFKRPMVGTDNPPTYLEIAGYPQLENISTNILEFFFDTQAEHEFKSLFVEALLSAANIEYLPEELEIESTQREAYTYTNTRLDLVLGNEKMLIGIENKIFHGLANDLSIYEMHLQNQAKGRKVVCVLLTLYSVDESAKLGKFIPITYTVFFEHVRKLLGHFVIDANQRYVPFLFDFMQTIEHLHQENIMGDLEFRYWVADHHEEIKDLLAEIRRFKGHLRDQVKDFQWRINVAKHKDSGVKITPWFYDPTDLSVRRVMVYDFILPDDARINIDVNINPTSWEIWIGVRESTPIEYLEKFLVKCDIKNVKPHGERNFSIGELIPYETPRSQIAITVQTLIDTIVATAQSQKEGNPSGFQTTGSNPGE